MAMPPIISFNLKGENHDSRGIEFSVDSSTVALPSVGGDVPRYDNTTIIISLLYTIHNTYSLLLKQLILVARNAYNSNSLIVISDYDGDLLVCCYTDSVLSTVFCTFSLHRRHRRLEFHDLCRTGRH